MMCEQANVPGVDAEVKKACDSYAQCLLPMIVITWAMEYASTTAPAKAWPVVMLCLKLVRRFAVLAGDPCQLPPVLTAPAEVVQLGRNPGPGSGAHASSGAVTAQHGLLRALFSRLAAPGCYHLLRQQYRCTRTTASPSYSSVGHVPPFQQSQ